MTKTKLVFATNNPHKIAEIRRLLGDRYDFLSLADIGCTTDLPETRDTLRGNARQKAEYVKKHFGFDCFSEDTGLEVNGLHGLPGVRTARYAGPERDDTANMAKVLGKLTGQADRSARFRTVICLVQGEEIQYFEGKVEGRIAEAQRGTDGFGYDPIFIPEDKERTFAEMGTAAKQDYSHRSRAMTALQDFLAQQSIQ